MAYKHCFQAEICEFFDSWDKTKTASVSRVVEEVGNYHALEEKAAASGGNHHGREKRPRSSHDSWPEAKAGRR